jgi:hypothetical protein
MKKPLLLVIFSVLPLFCPAVQASNVLASWSTWTDDTGSELDADFVIPGFNASIGYAGGRVTADYGSSDGTFGSLEGGTIYTNSALLVRARNDAKFPGGATLTLSLTNNTSSAYQIDSLHFDFSARNRPSKPLEHGFNSFDVVYSSGDLNGTGAVVGATLNLMLHDGGEVYDYPDFDFILADQLTDRILEAGESALFVVTFKGETDMDVSSGLDNVAFTGTKVDIPEPASCVILVGILSLSWVIVRRHVR